MFMVRPPNEGTTRASLLKNQAGASGDIENAGNEAAVTNSSKCSAFSLDKFSIIGTISSLVFFVILVIVLDLVISEKRRSEEMEFHNAILNNSFTLHGTPEEYIVIDKPFPYSVVRRIHRMDLNYVELSITDFYESFKYYAKPNSLNFRNMRFIGKLPKEARSPAVYFHHDDGLFERSIEFNQSIGPFTNFQLDQCDRCVLDAANPDNLTQFQDVNCLEEALIFFQASELTEKNYYLITNQGEIGNRRLTLTVKTFGWTLLDYNQDEGRFISMHNETEKIIQDIIRSGRVESLKQVHLRNTKIELSTLSSLAPYVTRLTLDTVNITGLITARLSEIFSNFYKLEELTLKFDDLENTPGHTHVSDAWVSHIQQLGSKRGSVVRSGNSKVFTVELFDLPSTVKVLRLSNVILTSETYVPPIQRLHLHLRLLALHAITFDDLKTWNMIQDKNFIKYDQFAWQNLNNLLVKKLAVRDLGDIPYFTWFDFLKKKINELPVTTDPSPTSWLFIDNLMALRMKPVDQNLTSSTTQSEMIRFIEARGAVVSRVIGDTAHPEAVLLEGDKRTMTWNGRGEGSYAADSTEDVWFKILNMEVFLDKNWRATSKW